MATFEQYLKNRKKDNPSPSTVADKPVKGSFDDYIRNRKTTPAPVAPAAPAVAPFKPSGMGQAFADPAMLEIDKYNTRMNIIKTNPTIQAASYGVNLNTYSGNQPAAEQKASDSDLFGLKENLRSHYRDYSYLLNNPETAQGWYDTKDALESQISAMETDRYKLTDQGNAIDLARLELNALTGGERQAAPVADGDYSEIQKSARYLTDPAYREQVKIAPLSQGLGAGVRQAYLDQMNPQEKQALLYYTDNGDYENAQNYYELIKTRLSERTQADTAEKTIALTKENPAAGVVVNAAASVTQGLGYVGTIVQNAKNEATENYERIDPNSAWFGSANVVQDTTEGLTGDIESPVWQTVAQLGLSGAQYLAALPFGPGAALSIMSTSAAGATALQATQSGATPEQALAVSTMAGAIEFLTEKLTVDRLFKILDGGKTSLTQALKSIGKQALAEGTEELVSEYANNLTDEAIMGANSQRQQLIDQYMAEGMDYEAAARKAIQQLYIINPMVSFAGGAALGGVMSGGAVSIAGVNSSAQTAAIGAQVKADPVIEYGLQTPQDSAAYKTASALQGKQLSGVAVTDKEIGTLYRQIADIDGERVNQYGTAGTAAFGTASMATDLEKRSFDVYYRAGRNQMPLSTVLEQGQEYTDANEAAYSAGLQDAMEDMKLPTNKSITRETASGFVMSDAAKAMEKSTIKTLDAMAKSLGVKMTVYASTAADIRNGFYDPKTRTIYISQGAKNPALVVAKHEITHDMAMNKAEAYGVYRDYVVDRLGAEYVNKAVAQIQQRYSDEVGQTLDRDGAIEEIVADFTEEILTSEAKINDVVAHDRTVGQQILDAIRRLIKKLTGGVNTVGQTGKYGLDMATLEKAESLWVAALKSADTVRAVQARPVAAVEMTDADRFMERVVGQDAAEMVAGTRDENGAVLYSLKDGEKFVRPEYTYKPEMQLHKNQHPFILSDGMSTNPRLSHLEVAQAAVGGGRTNKELYEFMSYGNVRISGEDNQLGVEMAVRPTAEQIETISVFAGERPIVYDFVGDGMKTLNSGTADSFKAFARIVNERFGQSDVRYSLRDSAGNTLTPAQAEFFKDSKVRDADGNLLVVYHGTNAEFTVFDKKAFHDKHGKNLNLGWGRGVFNLTDAKSIAQNYANIQRSERGRAYSDGTPKVMELYVNMVNPYDMRIPANETRFRNSMNGFTNKEDYENTGIWWNDIPDEQNKRPEAFIKLMKKEGYDGIIEDLGNVVVFSPNQIKSIGNKAPTEDADIRYSLKETDNADIINKAVEIFGTTMNWSETGYLTTDGKRLDFSGKREGASGGYRTEDHREIWYAYGEPSDVEGWETMVDFMAKGNIRILPENGGINLSVAPTKEQEVKLRAFIERNAGEVTVDFDDASGDTKASVDYPKRTLPSRIFNDMRAYFADGTVPAISDVQKYRYSLKSTSDLASQNAKLREMNDLLKAQFKRSDGIKADPKSVKRYAGQMLDAYDSEYARADLETRLTELYDFISNGTELTWEDVKSRASDIAADVLSEASVLNDDLYRQYKDLRKYLKATRMMVPENYRNDLDGGYAAFRKNNFGRLNLVNEGVSVDSVYAELTEMYPEFFNEAETSNPADQVMQIADVLDSLKPVYENPFGGDMDTASEYVANDIIDNFYETPNVAPTFADRQAAKMVDARIKAAKQVEAVRERMGEKIQTVRQTDAERLAAVRENKNERIAELRAASRERVQALLQTERARREKLTDKLMSRFTAQSKAGQERRTATAYRAKIRRIVKDLSGLLLRPNDKRHVPDALRKPVAAFLESIDMTSNQMGETTYNKMRDLKDAYERIAREGGEYLIDIDPDMVENVAELESIKGKRLRDLTLDELETLYQVAQAVRKSIRQYNKAFNAAIRQTIMELGEGVLADNATSKEFTEQASAIRRQISNLVGIDMLSSFEFFEELGPTMNKMFMSLRDGLDTKIRDVTTAEQYMKKLLGETKVDEWTGETAKTTRFSVTGGTIDLTVAQMMSLYLLNRQPSGQNHIYIGGVKAAPVVALRDGKRVISKSVAPVKVKIEDVAKIISTLTPAQIKVAEGISKFFTDVTAAWGNEVSMKLYGYNKFTEENYFPIVSDDNYLLTAFGEKSDATLKNMGFTKARIKNANNPIILEDAFEVYTRQADKMGSYHAFVLPLTDMQKVYNYKNENGSVKQAIEKKYGTRANGYFRTFMADINGGIRTDTVSSIVSYFTRKYKAAALGLNLRVIIQQPTSYIRAAAVMDAKYLAKGFASKPNWNEVVEHSPIAQWRDLGYFSLDTGRQMKDVFVGKPSWTDKFMWAIGKADQFAWSRMWNSVKFEVDATTDLATGTAEYWDAVSKRFSELVDKTQVIDTAFHRSQIMRSQEPLARMITSFMSEPTRQYNMLRTAMKKIQAGDTAAGKRYVSSVVTSMLFNALVCSLWDIYRDDDKEGKSFWQLLFEQLLGTPEKLYLDGNIPGQVTGMIPFVKDIFSIIAGYDVKMMHLEGFAKLTAAVKRTFGYLESLIQGEEPKYNLPFIMKDLGSALGTIFGIPVGNAVREIENAVSAGVEIANAPMAQFAIKRMFYNIRVSDSTNRAIFYDILFKVSPNGSSPDNKAYRKIYNEMIKAGYTDQGITAAMKNRQK